MTQLAAFGRRADRSAGAPAPRLDRASLGAMALTGASVIRLSLQFAVLPILARWIGPSEYGLVAMAMPFILLANVLADGGLGFALGRQRDASPELESTVFWLTAGIGAALAIASCLAAVPMGLILRQPRLPMLIAALSPILLMNGLTAVSNGRIIREGRFGVFAGGDLLSTLGGAAAALVAASQGWGAWSLVAQQLVLWSTKLAWVTIRGGAAIGMRWRFGSVRGLLGFGASAIGAILADFVARNVDSLIVGGVLGTTQLGYYAMAYQIARIPDMLITGPLYLYIFKAVARRTNEGDSAAVGALAISGLRLGATALAPLFCGLALVAGLAVPLVLGERWAGAATVLQLLAGAGFFFCLCSIMATTAMGMGRSGLQLSMSLILGATTVAVVAVAARFGLRAVAASLTCGVAAVSGLYMFRMSRELRLPVAALAGALSGPALGAGAMSVAVWGVGRLVQGHSAPVQLAGAVAVGALVYIAILAGFRERLLGDARNFGRAYADAPARGVEPVEIAG